MEGVVQLHSYVWGGGGGGGLYFPTTSCDLFLDRRGQQGHCDYDLLRE